MSTSSQPPNVRKSWIKKVREKRARNKGTKTAPVLSDTSQQADQVYIRVCMADLQTLDPSQESTGHMYLIQGTFADISRYAGTTVDWVIKIAHLVCDPLGVGRIFTHTSGVLLLFLFLLFFKNYLGVSQDWYNLDRDLSWQEVVHGKPLLPNIYEFVTTHPITLSKISIRHSRSVTTRGSQSQSGSTAFKTSLLQRDGFCVVTRSAPSIASHLIPRRVGSDGATEIMGRFVGGNETIDRYDPRIGIMLVSTVDHWVDLYQLGFYYVTVSY